MDLAGVGGKLMDVDVVVRQCRHDYYATDSLGCFVNYITSHTHPEDISAVGLF